MLRHRAVPLILTCVLLWCSGTATAQQIDSLAALKELAMALLEIGGSDQVLRLGLPGASLPPEALEPGGRIVGSLDQPLISRTVLVLEGTPEVVRSRLEQRLLAAGWARPVFPRLQRGGFAHEPFEISHFCKGDVSLRPAVTARPGDKSLVILYQGTSRQDVCAPGHVSVQPDAGNPMPLLYPPFGIRMQVTGMGGYEDQFMSSARLDTRRAVEDVLSHFASQLRAAGWKEGEKSKTGSFLAQQWQYADSTGANWSGLFVVSAPPSVVRRDLLFTVSKAQ